MITKVRASHIALQSFLGRTMIEILYWPGMNKDLEQYISCCTTCNSQPTAQAREPLLCHESPTRPWEKISIDLFEIEGTDYVITVDYYSRFFEVNQLNTKTSKEVIRKVQSHLAHHDIPDQILSDNGHPFSSAAFQDFAKQYAPQATLSQMAKPKMSLRLLKILINQRLYELLIHEKCQSKNVIVA